VNFLRRHRSKVLTFVGFAAPVVGGLITGGIFTAATVGAAIGVIAAKYAASPLNHDAERSADLAARLERIKQERERP
jgi:uncharacterized protein (DUF697 family)